jgi:hypothetical protein
LVGCPLKNSARGVGGGNKPRAVPSLYRALAPLYGCARTTSLRSSRKSALEGRNEATALCRAPTFCTPRKRCAVRRMRPSLVPRTVAPKDWRVPSPRSTRPPYSLLVALFSHTPMQRGLRFAPPRTPKIMVGLTLWSAHNTPRKTTTLPAVLGRLDRGYATP